MKTIADIIDGLSERIGTWVLWLTLAMVLVSAYNAVARHLGKWLGVTLTSNALNEAQWYLFSMVFLLGAGLALKRNSHVRVDVLFARLTPRQRAWINLLGGLFLLLPFCTWTLWVSWGPVVNSWHVRELSPDPGGLARWPIKLLIPVGLVLILLQGVAEILKEVAFLRGEGPVPAADIPGIEGDYHEGA